MPNGFIKNYDLLEEKSKIRDLLDLEGACEGFSKKIDSISGSSVIALVGPFGSGKSTLLHQIMTTRLETELWVEFDAWKYPDRKDLWEGFVLDLARVISPKELDEAAKEIRGTQNDDKKTLIRTLSRIPGFAVLEGLNHFFETSPAKRVDDIQRILNQHLGAIHKDLFIIIEDIDRSGDAGIFFLETLKQFLGTTDSAKKILAIVPMANDNYHKNIDSYLKSIDYFEFFEQTDIKLEKFVNEVFDGDLFIGELKKAGDNRLVWTGENRKKQTVSFLEGLFHEMPGVNMRILKLIIRKANLVFKNQVADGHEPDFRITLCLEASKYFKINDKTDSSYFDDFKKRNVVTRGNIFCSYLATILFNDSSIFLTSYVNNKEERQLRSSRYDFKFIERKDDNKESYPSYPWICGDDSGFGIVSFYKEY